MQPFSGKSSSPASGNYLKNRDYSVHIVVLKNLYVSTTVFIITQGNMRATCFD